MQVAKDTLFVTGSRVVDGNKLVASTMENLVRDNQVKKPNLIAEILMIVLN